MMLGSTAGAPPSRDCPAEIVDGGSASISGMPGRDPPTPPARGEEDTPPPPSRTEANPPPPPSRSEADPPLPSSLPPFPPSKNKGHVSSGEIAAAASDSSTQVKDRLIRLKVEKVSEDGNVQTQGGVGGARQRRKKGATMTGVSLPSTSSRPTSSMRPSLSSKNNGSLPAANDNLQDQLKKPANAVPRKRLKTPILLVVRSPGVNRVLAQGSPRITGVKQSPTPSPLSGLPSRNKRRKQTSKVWNDFDPVYDGNKLLQAKCMHCHRVFPATREAGTSQCNRHLLVCEERAKVNGFLDSMKSAMPSISADWTYDPERAHVELIRLIVLHELPFRIVEYEGFRRFVRSLNPAFELVCRSKIREDCINLFNYQKTRLREVLQEITSRVSLTTDLWTSRQIVSYMCITCHYISADWNLRKKVIMFSEADTPHDGTNLFNIMLECMQDWGLQEKIFSITLDNASNNNSCVNYMKANLLGKNLLPSKGDLLHGRCGAHVINLIVQDGLAITCMAVEKIRESIKFVRISPPRKKKFKEIIVQEGIKCKKKVSLDVPTRWNSTHLMIKTALEYRKAFVALKLQDLSYTFLPTSDEWEAAQSVCKLLEVFLDATMTVSGTRYPTSHFYFHELWRIYLTLEREAYNEDAAIRSMVEAMKTKFMKYWNLSYLNICLPVILDLRYKFKFLELCLKPGFESEAAKYLNKVKKTFKDLFAEYSSHEDGSTMENEEGTNIVGTTDDPWQKWNKQVQIEQHNRAKMTELSIYLKDPVHPQEDGFDILRWWSANAYQYPIIARIARDVLAAPVSAVASESAFSTGGRVLSEYRSHMLGETVEALICLQDWMRPAGTTLVSTITSDIVYATRSDIYGPSEDIFDH